MDKMYQSMNLLGMQKELKLSYLEVARWDGSSGDGCLGLVG